MAISRGNGEEERSDAPPVPRGVEKASIWLAGGFLDAVFVLGINGVGSTGLITLGGLVAINTVLVLLP